MNDSIILELKIQPNKQHNKISRNPKDGLYKIELKAKPVAGKANQELIRFLAKSLNIRQRQISIVKGLYSRHKVIKIESINQQKILDQLEREIQSP